LSLIAYFEVVHLCRVRKHSEFVRSVVQEAFEVCEGQDSSPDSQERDEGGRVGDQNDHSGEVRRHEDDAASPRPRGRALTCNRPTFPYIL